MAFIEYQTSSVIPTAGVNILQRSVDAVGGVDAYLTSGQSFAGWYCLPPTLGVVQLRFALRTQTATSTPRFQLYGSGGVSGTVFYYATDLDGGSYTGSALHAPVGQAVWQPTFNVTGNHTEILANFTTGSDPTAFKLLDAVSTIPAPSGAKRRGWEVGLGTTTASVPQAVQMTDGPWLSSEAAGKTFAAYTPLDGTASTVTVPIIATGGNLTVRATSSATISLVSLGGATDNGDGSITVPGTTRCYPAWSASNDLTLAMTKASAGQYQVSYSPFYVDTPPTPPTIAKLIPTSGPDAGGTLVDVIGTDLTGATAVDFGGTAGTGLTVDPSGGLATVTSPAHTAGPAPVTITTPAGTSNAATFLFTPPGAPTLTGIDPTEGPETGGTTALLTGTNLAGTIGVDFGGSPATIITTTDTALLVTTPAHAAGTVDVTATDGATTTDPLAFEFTEATGPVIDGPDVIANLVALLTSELGVPVSSRRSPTATKDSDPSVVVRRTGGPSKGVASDNPTVTIEAWAPTTTESFQLLQSARMVVIEAAEQGRAGLRRYDEFAGPADLPDPSTTNPRHTLTASVVTRLE
jgi:hypothetical protein